MKKTTLGKLAIKADHLGIIAFTYLIIYGILKLKAGFDWMTLLVLLIGIIGILIDGSILITNYRKVKKW